MNFSGKIDSFKIARWLFLREEKRPTRKPDGSQVQIAEAHLVAVAPPGVAAVVDHHPDLNPLKRKKSAKVPEMEPVIRSQRSARVTDHQMKNPDRNESLCHLCRLNYTSENLQSNI